MPKHQQKFRLPARQKVCLTIVLAIGLYVFFYCWTYDSIGDGMNSFIVLYSIGVPIFLLSGPAIIDLNSNKIFMLWLGLSILFLLIGLSTNHNDKFLVHHSGDFDRSAGTNSFIMDYSTSSLKALFFFLVAYKVINYGLKKITGNYIVNTFRAYSGYNTDAKRSMNGIDVASNILLLLVTIGAGLFGH
jgi:hypothetical protein